jgi:ElaB/YqjD/DUF883 family membrane-anchored ribosome-binding protein
MATEPRSSNLAAGSPPNSNDKLSGAATEAKARAENLGRKATETADQVRSTVAAGLSAAAGAVDKNADEGANRVRRAAHRTANALASGADYIRVKRIREMMDDAMDVAKSNPGAALLGALAIGFLVGRALSSRD